MDYSLLMIWVELGNVEVDICGCAKVRLNVDMFAKFWLCLGFFGKGRVQKGLG